MLRLQFRIRTLLIVTTVVAVGLGWWSQRVRPQQLVVAELRNSGADVFYDFQEPQGFDIATHPPNWPVWLVDILGLDFFCKVGWIELRGHHISDADLDRLRERQHALADLKVICLRETRVTDDGIARLQRAFRNCSIHHRFRNDPSWLPVHK